MCKGFTKYSLIVQNSFVKNIFTPVWQYKYDRYFVNIRIGTSDPNTSIKSCCVKDVEFLG